MRAFVGVGLGSKARQALAAQVGAERRELGRVRWIPEANWHVTLLFLGEIDEGQRARIGETLRKTCRAAPPFTLELGGGGAFPVRGKARVLWVGFADPTPMIGLQRRVAEACRSRGQLFDEKPYHPHVTVARCRSGLPRASAAGWASDVPRRIGSAFPVDRVHLFRSLLGTEGARYCVLDSFELSGSR